MAGPGSELTLMVVPAGLGVRMGLDRDEDGFFDYDEVLANTNPANASDFPVDSGPEGEGEGEIGVGGEGEGAAEGEGDGEGEGMPDGEGEGEAMDVGDGESADEGMGDAEGETEGTDEGESPTEGEGEGIDEGTGEGETEGSMAGSILNCALTSTPDRPILPDWADAFLQVAAVSRLRATRKPESKPDAASGSRG